MTAACLDELERIVVDVQTETKDKIAAIRVVLSYGHGQPTQSVEIDANKMSREELIAAAPAAIELLKGEA